MNLLYSGENRICPLVSVIIPVYNAAKYIRKCLDSVLCQTLQDFEVICVDDGSTDDSVSLMEEYKEADDRIQLIRQQNLYCGTARNTGLEYATGKYVYFLDADDYIASTLLEKAVKKAESTQADIVVFGGYRYNDITGETQVAKDYLQYRVVEKKNVFSRRDIPRDILVFSNPAPWTKLYMRDFIDEYGLRFQTLSSAEDIYFTKMAFALANRIVCIDEPLMYYRVGLTNNLGSTKYREPFQYMEGLRKLFQEFQNRGLFEELEQSFCSCCVNCLTYELEGYQNRSDRIDAYRTIMGDSLVRQVLSHEREYYTRPASYDYLQGLRIALWFHDAKNDAMAGAKTNAIMEEYNIFQLWRSHEGLTTSNEQLKSTLGLLRDGYRALSEVDKWFYLGLKDEDKRLFEAVVIDYTTIEKARNWWKKENSKRNTEIENLKKTLEGTNKRCETVEKELKNKQKELDSTTGVLQNTKKSLRDVEISLGESKRALKQICSSRSFKIGKTVTWLPRKGKKWFKEML